VLLIQIYVLDKEPRVTAPSRILLFHAPSHFLQTAVLSVLSARPQHFAPDDYCIRPNLKLTLDPCGRNAGNTGKYSSSVWGRLLPIPHMPTSLSVLCRQSWCVHEAIYGTSLLHRSSLRDQSVSHKRKIT
jgi:hypothetical protein